MMISAHQASVDDQVHIENSKKIDSVEWVFVVVLGPLELGFVDGLWLFAR